jgi:choline dehydrogenase-like flavoprotein
MIEDLNAGEQDLRLKVDVCIVGAGAAGITIARQLGRRGLSVCLAEGGGAEYEDRSQALFTGVETGIPVNLGAGRLRQLGGSTNHWGGRCGRLDPLDFAPRSWVPYSGWPIGLRELGPYYQRALAICGFEQDHPSAEATIGALPNGFPAFRSDRIRPYIWRFTPSDVANVGLRFGKVYRKELQESRNIRVVLHASFLRMKTSPNGDRVTGVLFGTLRGRKLHVEASSFVLCAGGAENPRLLLIGDGERAIGNRNGAVGRFFTQQPRCHVGTFIPNAAGQKISKYFEWDVLAQARRLDASLPKTQIGICLSPKTMVREKLLNASLSFDYDREHVREINNAALRKATSSDVRLPTAAEFASLLQTDLRSLVNAAHERGSPIRSVNLVVDVEQQPDPANRIGLARQRDDLGLPRSLVAWRVSERERATARMLAVSTAAELGRLGWGRTRLEPWVLDSRLPLDRPMCSSFHFSGTTRMGGAPGEGVVDADCKVHGVANLYVAGSSVFPTVGHVNPTFTIVALATRLADHLGAQAGALAA